jgi:hypothetical protein
MPDMIFNLKLNDESLSIIINMIMLYNFNSSYTQPWNVFETIE